MSRKTTFRRAIIGLLICTQVTPALLAGDLLRGMGRVLSAPIDHLHRKKPNSGQCPDLEKVAREIDWLEHYLDTYGSVVAKQPDAWGEARMTKHRREFEREISKLFCEDRFEETLQGSLRRSDQSFLSLSLALGAGASTSSNGGSETQTTTKTEPDAETKPDSPDTKAGDSTASTVPKPELPGGELPTVETRTTKFKSDSISLEPTVVADQFARYLNHLNEIRRINEGDDTADSPGYALNLLRIPVSVLPGKKTDQGYGAEITFTAQPHLSDDLLPTTVRNLIVNDASDMLALPLAMYLNNDRKEVKKFIKQFRESEHQSQLLMSRVLSQERLANADQALRINAAYLTSRLTQLLLVSKQNSNAKMDVHLHRSKFIGTELDGILEGALIEFTVNDFVKLIQSITTFRNGTLEVKASIFCVNSEKPLKGKCPTQVTLGSDFEIEQAMMCAQAGKDFQLPLKFSFDITKFEPDESDGDGKNIATRLMQCLKTDDVADATRIMKDFFGHGLANNYSSAISTSIGNAFGDALASQRLNPMQMLHTAPARIRRSRNSLPPSQLFPVVGAESTFHILESTYETLNVVPASSKHIHLTDISRVLKSELQAAYELLSKPEYGHLWDQFCTPELTDAIHRVSAGKSQNDVNRIRREFMASLPVESQHKVTSGLAWVIIAEAALLNESLTHDMRRVGQQKGCMECVPIEGINFCQPTPAPEAIEAFKSYVNCRWPIHVFALDPVNQEQNISDSFSRRRELQLAVAVAVATGEMNVNAAGKYMRKLETDIDTIALNRTHFGFAHDNDTFGWRFQPRFQSPDTAGQLRAFGETLFGTRRNADIRDQKIEPGMRECVAVVIMPSFVPYVTLSSRANWYDLVNPRRKEWTMKETMKLSRNYQAVQSRVHSVCAGNCYRAEDVAGLSDSLSQLEKRFPIQHRMVQIPYENTSGGFEIFSEGVTDLGPELLGWYGAPGIRVGESTEPSTSLFLVGDGFSVHETRFIVGGHAIAKENVRLLSRQIAEVIVPPTVNIVDYEAGNPVKKYVDAHVATPYGATNHLLIPVYVPPKKAEAKKISEEIAELKATTDVMQSISIKPADGTKYAFDTVCPQEQGGPLRFDLRDASKVRVLNFASNIPIADPSELVFEIALFDKGFVTPMLELKNAEIALDANDSAKGKITLKEGALENVVARLPGLATLAKLKEADDQKKTYKVVFFMRTVKRKAADDEVADGNKLPNVVNVPRPIRVGGDLPVEVKLTCDCCKGGSCETHTANAQGNSRRGVRLR